MTLNTIPLKDLSISSDIILANNIAEIISGLDNKLSDVVFDVNNATSSDVVSAISTIISKFNKN